MTPSDIPVVILCGGQGTRLREETEFRPKPMVPVGDRPLLWHLMKHYAHYGHTRFVLCLGYRGEVIKDYFFNYEARHSDFTVHLSKRQVDYHATHAEDWQVTLADTGQAAMTGARIKRVARYLDAERFCLTYGDGLSDVDLAALLRFHRAHGKLVTLTTVRPPSRFGQMDFDGDRITAFTEKPTLASGAINGGFFVCERGVLDYLASDDGCTFERGPLERLAADGQLMAYRHDGFWQCMDTLRDMTLLNSLWESGDAPWRVWDRPAALEARVPHAPLSSEAHA